VTLTDLQPSTRKPRRSSDEMAAEKKNQKKVALETDKAGHQRCGWPLQARARARYHRRRDAGATRLGA